jgi:hypothetical protein
MHAIDLWLDSIVAGNIIEFAVDTAKYYSAVDIVNYYSAAE